MRVGVIWVVGDGLKYFFFCLLLPPFLTRSDAKIIVSGGAVGIDLDCLGQLGQCVIEFGLPIIDDAERRMRKLLVR